MPQRSILRVTTFHNIRKFMIANDEEKLIIMEKAKMRLSNIKNLKYIFYISIYI